MSVTMIRIENYKIYRYQTSDQAKYTKSYSDVSDLKGVKLHSIFQGTASRLSIMCKIHDQCYHLQALTRQLGSSL